MIGSLSSETEARLTKAVPGKLAKISDSPPVHVLETTTDDLRKFSERINNMVETRALWRRAARPGRK